MKEELREFQLQKTSLFKIFSSLDTQSAVVAAVVISVLTFLSAGFFDLCNYIYWSAYFTKFRIPLAYMDEAIIHENGIKYIAVLCVPAVLFVWWLLGVIRNVISIWMEKRRKDRRKPIKKAAGSVLKAIAGMVVFLGLIFLWDFEASWIILVFYTEFAIFLWWSQCKGCVTEESSCPAKVYYTIRIVGVLVMIYVFLGGVYYAGSFANYSRDSAQSLQLINAENVNYYQLEQDKKVDAQLVLLETADYYYVTDVVVVKNTNGLFVQIWNDDTYRFVDKIDRPVKSVFAWLSYIDGRDDEGNISKQFDAYVVVTFICIAVFVRLLSIPKEEKSKGEIDRKEA